ncbi:hypothetical protein GCM10010518_51540 [Kitasatospora cinereorecta]
MGAEAEAGVDTDVAAALSKAAATRSDAGPSSRPAVVVDRAEEDEAGAGTEALAGSAAEVVVSDSGSVGWVRSAWGGTVAVVGSSCSVRPNTLRSKLRMPMGEAFRMSWVR